MLTIAWATLCKRFPNARRLLAVGSLAIDTRVCADTLRW